MNESDSSSKEEELKVVLCEEEEEKGIKLFNSSNKPIFCSEFELGYLNPKLYIDVNKNRDNYLNNEITNNERKRKRSSYVNNQIEKSGSDGNDKEERNKRLEELKQSLISYDELITNKPLLPPVPNKKGQIVISSSNTEYTDKHCTNLSTTQYSYKNIYLSKPLFDQIYTFEKGEYKKETTDETEETTTTAEQTDKEEEEEEKEEKEVEKEQEVVEQQQQEEEDCVVLFPYNPVSNVYNIIDDSEDNIIPYSNFNHRYKYHNTNVTLYNIYKETHYPGENSTIIDKNEDILKPQEIPKPVTNKKLKKKKFFKRG